MYYLVSIEKPNCLQALYIGASPFEATQIISINPGATIDIVENDLAAQKLFLKKNEALQATKASGSETGNDYLNDLQALKDVGLETVGNVASFGLTQLEALDKTLDLKQGVETFLENITKGGSDALNKANDFKVVGANVIGEVFLKIGNFLKNS